MDTWDPDRYHRFRAERAAPFFDLLALVEPTPAPVVVDLGCGSGELTAEAHRTLGARTTVGIDSSPAMLEHASALASGGLSFRQGDLRALPADLGPVDVVLSNAALQWVGEHEQVLTQWRDALAGGGQLAVQMPANADHPSHVVAREVAAEEPFRSEFGGEPPPDPVLDVLAPEQYASILDALGFARQHVRLQVYPHRLASTAEVVEWVRGTSLTRFEARLDPDVYAAFVDRYRARLLEVAGDQRPYLYTFKRILFWARLA